MEPCLAITPELHHARHDQGEEWTQEFLEVVPNEKIFLPRFTDNRCRIDSVMPMVDSLHVKYRIIVPERVVTIVISKRTFGEAFARRYESLQNEFGFRREGMGAASISGHRNSVSSQQRSHHQLPNVFRQRGYGS